MNITMEKEIYKTRFCFCNSLETDLSNATKRQNFVQETYLKLNIKYELGRYIYSELNANQLVEKLSSGDAITSLILLHLEILKFLGDMKKAMQSDQDMKISFNFSNLTWLNVDRRIKFCYESVWDYKFLNFHDNAKKAFLDHADLNTPTFKPNLKEDEYKNQTRKIPPK